jgi:hypothetical protein
MVVSAARWGVNREARERYCLRARARITELEKAK